MLTIARLCLQFGRVPRATLHPDGVQPESDTDHTVMLGIFACALAEQWPHLNLDRGLLAQMALVHDLVEAYAGDTNSFAITASSKAAKEEREAAALDRIQAETRDYPWIADTIAHYERGQTPEARFLRYLDKVTPKLTHALNGCAALRRMGKSREEVRAVHDIQIAALAKQYPEFESTVGALLIEACRMSEDAYVG